MNLTTKHLKDESFNFKAVEEFLANIPDGNKLKTCIQCGSCSSGCPAADKLDLTRRQVWRMLQMGLLEEAINTELFWDCTTCEMCQIRCPRGIPLAEIIIKLRERYNQTHETKAAMEQVSGVIEKYRNITGDEAKNRLLWTENIQGITQEERKGLIKDRAKVVYFTGCVSSLFPQSYKIPQALTYILLKAGVDFSLLGEDEWCCGLPLVAGGSGEKAIREYAIHNLNAIKKKGADTVVFSCPTCYHFWKNEYARVLGNELDINIKHYTEYLPQILQSVQFSYITDEIVVTYHDPCDLGRKSQIFDTPREIIKSMPGVKLVEMRFTKEDSKCCGGGGNLEMLNSDLSFEIAQKRIAEAAATNAQYLLTTCQQCKRTLQNAARRTKSRIKVNDLLEFLAVRINSESGGEKK